MKTADQIRPSSRRGASGAWGRLKPVREDALETYGLPSKGETRLNNYSAQETYFNRIIERYMKLCAMNKDELDQLFKTMSDKHNNNRNALDPSMDPEPCPIPAKALIPSINELATVLTAMRKMREAITAINRADHFARRAYFFGVHVAILCKDWESYIPGLNSLLTIIHAKTPLSSSDLREYVGFLILDQACRQGDLAGARETRMRYGYEDRRVDMVLKALVADNWVVFWKMKKAVDGYQRRIMEFAEQNMRIHALKCLGRGYMSADRPYVERCADRQWPDLVEDGVGWELTDTDKVLIKKPKAK